ncbi:MAG TPA: NYN domain-containing protein [Terriglobales bacterium]|nr:NYN domain-containing protein [Terriglobales bacterium]
MFTPKTKRIQNLIEKFPYVVEDLDPIFGSGSANVYLDYGNVRNWSNRLEWHIDLKRLKQLLDSFGGKIVAKFYYGTRDGMADSEELIRTTKEMGYKVLTKPVKTIKLSIDVSSVSPDSPDILRNLICTPLLKTLSVQSIEHLNDHLRDLNKKGVLSFDDLKCNFDVEMGRDMLVDQAVGEADVFALWSCDSDFAGSVEELLDDGKQVVVFGTSGMVARELNMLRSKGLKVYDVKKLKEMICWARELPEELKTPKSQEDTLRCPQAKMLWSRDHE